MYHFVNISLCARSLRTLTTEPVDEAKVAVLHETVQHLADARYGGPSSYGVYSQIGCTGYRKPNWQTVPGVPQGPANNVLYVLAAQVPSAFPKASQEVPCCVS